MHQIKLGDVACVEIKPASNSSRLRMLIGCVRISSTPIEGHEGMWCRLDRLGRNGGGGEGLMQIDLI